MTHITITPGYPLTGACSVPGDKSISHRAVIFGSIATGESRIRNFLDGGDCHSTVHVMRGLGVEIEMVTATELLVQGRGLDGLQEPGDVLDCGNSGTTIRLLLGLLAGQKFVTFLTGTARSRRGLKGRVVRSLCGMGADMMWR